MPALTPIATNPEFNGLPLDELVRPFRGPAPDSDEGPATTFAYSRELTVHIPEAGHVALGFRSRSGRASGRRLGAGLFGFSLPEIEPTLPTSVSPPDLAQHGMTVPSVAATGAAVRRAARARGPRSRRPRRGSAIAGPGPVGAARPSRRI